MLYSRIARPAPPPPSAVMPPLMARVSPPGRPLSIPGFALRPRFGLSDALFEWFAKWIYGAEFDRVVIEVHKRVNSNYYPWYCGDIIRCLTYDAVKHILIVYMQLVMDGVIPEYEPGVSDTQDVTAVAREAGDNGTLTGHVLYELYYATQDGSVASDATLRPKHAAEHPEFYKTPASADSLDNIMGTIVTWLKVGLVVGALALLVFIGYKAYQTYEEVAE